MNDGLQKKIKDVIDELMSEQDAIIAYDITKELLMRDMIVRHSRIKDDIHAMLSESKGLRRSTIVIKPDDVEMESAWCYHRDDFDPWDHPAADREHYAPPEDVMRLVENEDGIDGEKSRYGEHLRSHIADKVTFHHRRGKPTHALSEDDFDIISSLVEHNAEQEREAEQKRQFEQGCDGIYYEDITPDPIADELAKQADAEDL